MRALIYKRTHDDDPGKTGQFGIYNCMGRVRTWDFEAVIGVGGRVFTAASHALRAVGFLHGRQATAG